MECRENNVVYVVDFYCEVFKELEKAFEYCKEKFNENNYCVKYNIEWDFNYDEYTITCIDDDNQNYLNYKIKKKTI